MNIPVRDGDHIEFLPPVSTPGSYVTLQAEMDCIIVFSACPQDMIPINGAGDDRRPRRISKLSAESMASAGPQLRRSEPLSIRLEND